MAKSAYTTRYESLAKELIHEILGFQEWEENFTPSMNYVMSNLLYHHYMDVNNHHVQRSLQGISLKMTIHGHQKKAERMLSLTERFLSSTNLQNKGDLKWSILLLLIELGQHPARDGLSSSFSGDVDADLENQMKETEDADWVRELMLKSFHLPDKEETLSEWSDDDEMKRSFSLGIDSVSQQSIIQKSSTSLESKPSKQIEEREKRNILIKEYHQAKSWLANTIQRDYWSSPSDKLIVNAGREDRFGVLLTESIIMKESIWLFLSPSSGFIFKQSEDEFNIQPICTSSISKESMKEVLQPITSAASKLLNLDIWLKETAALIPNENQIHVGSLQAYADGLRQWRHGFNSEVVQLEKKLFSEEGCLTLLWFLKELEPHFSSLSVIHNVHSKAFGCHKDSLLTKTLKLIGLLVQGLESGLSLAHKAALLCLLNSTLKNHLGKLHSLLWDLEPHTVTFLEEFGIVRNDISSRIDVTKQFKLDDNPFLNLNGLNFIRALREPLMKISELKKIVKDLELEEQQVLDPETLCSMVEKKLWEEFRQKRFWENSLTESVLNLKICCESKNVIGENLAKESIIDSASLYCNTEKKVVPMTSESNEEVQYGGNDINCLTDGELEKLSGDEDKLSINVSPTKVKMASEDIQQLFTQDIYLVKASEENDLEMQVNNEESSYCKVEDYKGSIRFEKLLMDTLLPVAQNRYNQLGKVILKSLVDTHNLKKQLNVFKSIVLLESSSLMQEFYSYFFTKIDSQDSINQIDLTQNLQYALGLTCSSKLASSFRISFIVKEDVLFEDTTGLLNSLSVEFGDLWPLQIVLTKSDLAKYNQIFGFCLMLKKATFTLENLHFKDIGSFSSCYSTQNSSLSAICEEEISHTQEPTDKTEESELPLPQRIHRLQLLRQWLLYFSRILHDHFSTAVFLPFSQKMEKSFDSNVHFDDFLQEHVKLLNNVCHQCLINEEGQSPIQRFLTKIFFMVKDLRNLWTGHPSRISEKELNLLEEQYSLCHRLIANFFSTLARVRFCPLVEGLSECLNYNCPK